MADSKPLSSLDGSPATTEALLWDVFGIVVDEAIRKGTNASEKVCEWKEPEELKQLLDLELRSQGESQEQILERCRTVIRYSVKTCHPRFFNQLFSGLDPHSLAGRIITESLNTSQGKMIPEDLERQISLAEAEGAVPFLVSATSGTTVLGAFDPLEAIADVCQRHGLWLHVDAAWGGSVLLSQTHRHLLDGIQRYLVEEIKKREGFELVMEPEFVNVCFWFVPPSLRGKQQNPDYSEKLAKVAPMLKERMVKAGSMMIGYQPHGALGNFFRMVVANPMLTQADIDFLLNELERLGQDL